MANSLQQKKEEGESFLLSVAIVLIAAFGYGAVGIFFKKLSMHHIGVTDTLTWRFGLTCLLLTPLVFRKLICVSTKDLSKIILLGLLGFALQATTYLLAVDTVGAGAAALLLYLYPSFVMILEKLWNGPTKINFSHVFLLILSWCGSLLVLQPSSGKISLLGFALGVSTALIYSIVLIASHSLNKSIHPVVVSWGVSLGAWLGFFCFNQVTPGIPVSFDPRVWFTIMGMVFVGTLVPLSAIFMAIRRLGPTKTALLSMTEPLFAITLGVLCLGESMTAVQLCGGIFIIVSACLLVGGQRYEKSERKFV